VEGDGIAAAARAAMNDAPGLLEDGEREAIEAAGRRREGARGSDHHAIREASRISITPSKPFATRDERALEQGFRGRNVDAVDASWSKVEGRPCQSSDSKPDGIEIEVPIGTKHLEASNRRTPGRLRLRRRVRLLDLSRLREAGLDCCRTPRSRETSWKGVRLKRPRAWAAVEDPE